MQKQFWIHYLQLFQWILEFAYLFGIHIHFACSWSTRKSMTADMAWAGINLERNERILIIPILLISLSEKMKQIK